jgi:phosphoglycolate phosphatase
MSTRLEVLVFDWDGTLADSEARIVACALRAIEELSLPARSVAQVREIIGLGLREAVEALFPDDAPQRIERGFVDAYRRHFLDCSREPIPLFPGARETLEALSGRYALAVATGKSRRGLDREVAENALDGLFDATRCADEAPSKPHPAMLDEILAELGFAAAEALVIGDTEFDMQMARSAGAAGVAVASGVHEPDRLMRAGALEVIATVADLPAWLERARVG